MKPLHDNFICDCRRLQKRRDDLLGRALVMGGWEAATEATLEAGNAEINCKNIIKGRVNLWE